MCMQGKKRGFFMWQNLKKIRGIWVPLSQIPANLGSLSEKFQKFWAVWKKKDFVWQFLVKTGFWADVRGANRGSKVWQSESTIVICEWSPIGSSSWAWTWTAWPWLNLAHACLDIHGLKYMDINTVYSAPPSTLLTKSKILQSEFQCVCVCMDLTIVNHG